MLLLAIQKMHREKEVKEEIILHFLNFKLLITEILLVKLHVLTYLLTVNSGQQKRN